MKRHLFELLLTGFFVLCLAASVFAQNGPLPANCITFREVKFVYLPKGNFQYGIQKLWTQIDNNCGQNLEHLVLKGYITNSPTPQNWTYQFVYGFAPVPAGAIGTGVAEYTATDATFLRLTVEQGTTVLAEKIFEPQEFDKMRFIREDKSKKLPMQPVKPQFAPSSKPWP